MRCSIRIISRGSQKKFARSSAPGAVKRFISRTSASETAEGTKSKRKKKAQGVWVEKVDPRKN